MGKIRELDDIPTAAEILASAVLEDGKLWVRYIGPNGPRADTILGEMFQGDPILFNFSESKIYPNGTPEQTLKYLLSSGEWMPMIRGRCSGIMRLSKERCIQENAEGKDLCPLHQSEQERREKKE